MVAILFNQRTEELHPILAQLIASLLCRHAKLASSFVAIAFFEASMEQLTGQLVLLQRSGTKIPADFLATAGSLSAMRVARLSSHLVFVFLFLSLSNACSRLLLRLLARRATVFWRRRCHRKVSVTEMMPVDCISQSRMVLDLLLWLLLLLMLRLQLLILM